MASEVAAANGDSRMPSEATAAPPERNRTAGVQRWRLACFVLMMAVVAPLAARAYFPTLHTYAQYMLRCIDGADAGIIPHPWSLTDHACWDTRFTRLVRFLSMRKWMPESDNNHDRFHATEVLSESDCRDFVNLARNNLGGFVPGGRYKSSSRYYSEASEFRQTEVRALLNETFQRLETRETAIRYASAIRNILQRVREYFGDECIWIEHVSQTMRKVTPADLDKSLWELRLTGGHPFHNDACNFAPWEARCERNDVPADNARNFSAVVYLQPPEEDFAGGEFYILDGTRWNLPLGPPWLGPALQHLLSYLYVTPKCGAMVSYRNYNDPAYIGSIGGLNHHGTLAVEKGQRYSLGMWFTKTYARRGIALNQVLDDILGREDFKCPEVFLLGRRSLREEQVLKATKSPQMLCTERGTQLEIMVGAGGAFQVQTQTSSTVFCSCVLINLDAKDKDLNNFQVNVRSGSTGFRGNICAANFLLQTNTTLSFQQDNFFAQHCRPKAIGSFAMHVFWLERGSSAGKKYILDEEDGCVRSSSENEGSICCQKRVMYKVGDWFELRFGNFLVGPFQVTGALFSLVLRILDGSRVSSPSTDPIALQYFVICGKHADADVEHETSFKLDFGSDSVVMRSRSNHCFELSVQGFPNSKVDVALGSLVVVSKKFSELSWNDSWNEDNTESIELRGSSNMFSYEYCHLHSTYRGDMNVLWRGRESKPSLNKVPVVGDNDLLSSPKDGHICEWGQTRWTDGDWFDIKYANVSLESFPLRNGGDFVFKMKTVSSEVALGGLHGLFNRAT